MKKILKISSFVLSAVIATAVYAEGLYPSSVVGTDFDYITADDPNTFLCMEYESFKDFETPDKRGIIEINSKAYVFNAHFTDGTQVDIAVHEIFGSKEAAEKDALRYTSRLGKLPTLYRENINHVVVHKGGVDTTAFAEDAGHFLVVYSDNALKRISTHDLEETFFHEGSHAAIQIDYLESAAWKDAQEKDGQFVTNYASTNAKEDFAETALFAYTLMHHPERIPAADRVKIEAAIPNRLAFFEDIFASPVTYSVGAKHVCSAAAALPSDVPSEDNIVVPTSDTTVVPSADRNADTENTYETAVPTDVAANTDENGEIFYGGQSVPEALWDVLVLELDVAESDVISFLEPWHGKKFTSEVQSELIAEAANEFNVSQDAIKDGFASRYGVSLSVESRRSLLEKLYASLLQLFDLLLGN